MASFTAFLNTIILLGAVQGFIMSGLLFFSRKQRQSNRLLAALIFLISLACFNLYGNSKNWFDSDILRFLADLIPLVIVMPFGPLMYFYVQSILDPGFKITRKQRLHFLPVIIDLVPSLTIIIFIIGIMARLVKNNPGPWGGFIDSYNVYADIPRWASITFYLWLSARYFSAIKAKSKINANELPANFKWLQQFIRVFLVFQCIWLLYLIPYVIPKYSNALVDTLDWYPIYIPMAIIIYWLGIKGYITANTSSTVKKAANIQSTLSPAAIQQAVASLEKAMAEDKLYLNPGLNLDMVAQQTGLTPKTISAVLNQHLNKSFNEYINGYRVEAFKEKVLLPHMDNLTIAGIAYECGFNSQATFQRTFKQITGMSPTEFRKSVPEAG